MVIEAGGSGDKTVVAHLVGADGKLVPRTPPRPRLPKGEIRGFVATWDGEAVAVALEHGDFGREAGGSGSVGWGARPDSHEIRLLRIGADGTQLGEVVALERAADVGRPTGLVVLDGHYWLAGGEFRPSTRRRIEPQLVRFDRTGAVTQRVPLGLPRSAGDATLHLEAGMLRGAVTDQDEELRTFTVRCAPPS